MTRVLVRRRQEDPVKEEGDVMAKAEVGVIPLQRKNRKPRDVSSLERQENGFSPRASRRSLLTPRKNIFVLF